MTHPPCAHPGWRLLALVYDSLPVLALWLAASALVLLLRGGVPVVPCSLAWWLQVLGLWGLTGLYAVESWRHGGQTLGMRPWRLRVEAAGASRARLWARYALASLGLLAGGAGLWIGWFSADRCTPHDRLSGTRLVRLPRPD